MIPLHFLELETADEVRFVLATHLLCENPAGYHPPWWPGHDRSCPVCWGLERRLEELEGWAARKSVKSVARR